MALGGNTIWIDSSKLQYAPWRALTGYLVQVPPAEEIPYRPIEWGKEPQLTFIKVSDPLTGQYTDYFFDAVFRVEHTKARIITEHPVQTGANIADHSYQLPTRVTIEIGMSDVMDSYQSGQWDASGEERSVNAYKKLCEIEDSGLPLTLCTRLDDYENMVIENIHAPDDFTTKYGLKTTIVFKQIITVEIAVTKISTNVQATGKTNKGFVSAPPPSWKEESAVESWFPSTGG